MTAEILQKHVVSVLPIIPRFVKAIAAVAGHSGCPSRFSSCDR